MTFPIVETTNVSVEATAVTTHDVSLPSSVAAGDWLLAALFGSQAIALGGVTSLSGWTEILDVSERSLHKLEAAGGETTAQWSSGNSTESVHTSHRISGAEGSIEFALATSADPPSLSPSWGADDTLWIVVLYHDTSDAGDITAAPSGYSGLIKTAEVTSGARRIRLGAAWKQANAASEDPGAFSTSGTVVVQRTLTIAVRPAVSAAGAAKKAEHYRQRRI